MRFDLFHFLGVPIANFGTDHYGSKLMLQECIKGGNGGSPEHKVSRTSKEIILP